MPASNSDSNKPSSSHVDPDHASLQEHRHTARTQSLACTLQACSHLISLIQDNKIPMSGLWHKGLRDFLDDTANWCTALCTRLGDDQLTSPDHFAAISPPEITQDTSSHPDQDDYETLRRRLGPLRSAGLMGREGAQEAIKSAIESVHKFRCLVEQLSDDLESASKTCDARGQGQSNSGLKSFGLLHPIAYPHDPEFPFADRSRTEACRMAEQFHPDLASIFRTNLPLASAS